MPTTQRPTTKPTTGPNFQITSRLLAVNADIVRMPLIRRDQLRARHPHIPDRSFHQLVYNLTANQFARCPKAQNQYRRTVSGSLPTYLTPTKLGCQLHRAFFADPVPDQKHDEATDPRTWEYMCHEANTSNALLQYENSAVTIHNLTFYAQPDLWTKFAPAKRLHHPVFDLDLLDDPNEPLRVMAHDFIADCPFYNLRPTRHKPLRLSAQLEWPMRLPGQPELQSVPLTLITHPDGYFGHDYTTEQRFFFESDEDSETILPNCQNRHSAKLLEDTSLLQKSLAYTAAYRKFFHVRYFGISSFKVIFETTTPLRAYWIRRKLAPILLKPPLSIHPTFILTDDRQTLAANGNDRYHPDHFYKDLKGRDVHLLDL